MGSHLNFREFDNTIDDQPVNNEKIDGARRIVEDILYPKYAQREDVERIDQGYLNLALDVIRINSIHKTIQQPLPQDVHTILNSLIETTLVKIILDNTKVGADFALVRCVKVIAARYGLADGKPMTLDAIAKAHIVSEEELSITRVSQLIDKGIWNMYRKISNRGPLLEILSPYIVPRDSE